MRGGRTGLCTGPVRQRSSSSGSSLGDLAADEHEQPVAGLQPRRAARQQRLVAADDQRDERVARQPEVAQARARRRVARADHVLDHVGAELAHGADLEDRGGAGGSSDVTPSQRATGSIVVPCSSVESSTAKKTMLKNVSTAGTSSITGKIASTTGTAPRSPAQPSSPFSRS